jgi:hypothetical protein
MANPQTVKQWNIDADYALVEVQVNDGMGAPAQEGFVATNMRRLDGTKDFPAKLPEIVADARKRQQQYQKDQQKAVDEALAEIQKTALKQRKLTGPRETKEHFYITWLPETEKYRLNFRTTVTDGAYEFIEINRGRPVPLPLPPPPGPGKGAPPAVPPANVQQGAALPPPPPPPPFPMKVRTGTTIGVEFGVAYEVSKAGKVERVLILPAQTFSQELPVPPQFRGGPIDRLPPQPLKEKD